MTIVAERIRTEQLTDRHRKTPYVMRTGGPRTTQLSVSVRDSAVVAIAAPVSITAGGPYHNKDNRMFEY